MSGTDLFKAHSRVTLCPRKQLSKIQLMASLIYLSGILKGATTLREVTDVKSPTTTVAAADQRRMVRQKIRLIHHWNFPCKKS